MERLAALLADFRDEHGDDPEENKDTFAALLDILETAEEVVACLLYTSPSPRDATLSRMPSSA